MHPANAAWATATDTDLITETDYRADGQVRQVRTNVDDRVFTVTEPITVGLTQLGVPAVR